jgi:HK97 family phage major capsid protein
MEEYIGEILGARLWRGQEYYACQGTGSSQPGGIASGATSALTAASATEVTASEVIQLTSAIDEVYRGAPNARIVMNSTTLGEIETLVAGDGHYLLHHFADGAMTIQGMRIVTSSQMPDTSTGKKAIAAGDFNFLAFNEVGPIRLKWLDQLYQGTGQIGVRAYMRSGSAITCPTAIKVITMA